MHTKILRTLHLGILLFLLSCMYGCNLSGLSGADGGTGSGFTSGGGGGSDAGTQIATLHQPEPATMALLGSGFMAMAYRNHRRKNKKTP